MSGQTEICQLNSRLDIATLTILESDMFSESDLLPNLSHRL